MGAANYPSNACSFSGSILGCRGAATALFGVTVELDEHGRGRQVFTVPDREHGEGLPTVVRKVNRRGELR